MRNHILYEFALKDLKKHRKDTLIILSTLIMVAIMSMLIVSFTPIFANQEIADHQKTYGHSDYFSISSLTMDEIENMQISLNGEMTSLQEADVKWCLENHVGQSLTNDSISYVEQDSSILAVHLQSGKMPTQKDEIAIATNTLEKLGYEKILNQTIHIPYYDSEMNYHVGTWKIVGILEPTNYLPIIIGEPINDQFSLYIDTNQQTIDNYQALNLEWVYNTFELHDTEVLVTVVQFTLFVIGCMIMSGVSISAFENRKKDYTLLRGIGATKRQLYYIVFLQSLILAGLSLLVTGIVSPIIIYCVKAFVETIIPLEFHMNYFMGVVLSIVLMTLISYFMPARGACFRALSGSFDGMEFQYFYYRYKKLHHMRPMYLGWRQLVNHKKQMIVKIFLVFIVSLLLMNIIGSHLYQQQLYQQKEALFSKSHTNEISLEFSVDNPNHIELQDMDIFKPYSDKILSFHITYYPVYSSLNDVKIYCLDDDVKEEFSIEKDLQPGEVIISKGLTMFTVDSILAIKGTIYQIVDQLEDYEESFMIMNKDTFQKYGDIEHYQISKVYFDSVQQKTDGLIAYAFNNKSVKYNILDSLASQQDNINYELSEQESIPLIPLCVIVACSVIYIYQLAYEIIKQREIIGTYQLLGFRKHEIWSIYAFKSFFIALIGLIFALYGHFADYYISYQETGLWRLFLTPVNLCWQVIPAILLIIILIVLSLIPIYSLLSKDGFDNINVRE